MNGKRKTQVAGADPVKRSGGSETRQRKKRRTAERQKHESRIQRQVRENETQETVMVEKEQAEQQAGKTQKRSGAERQAAELVKRTVNGRNESRNETAGRRQAFQQQIVYSDRHAPQVNSVPR